MGLHLIILYWALTLLIRQGVKQFITETVSRAFLRPPVLKIIILYVLMI